MTPRLKLQALCLMTALLAVGCVTAPRGLDSRAVLSPLLESTKELKGLPPPAGKIPVAVYSFRDQTGQYKANPESSFSTAVTQGSAAMLVKALNESGWFTPVERENLQNLLTERKILRAIEQPDDKATATRTGKSLPNLVPAELIIEGAIVGYDSNVRTGGLGAKYLGIGASDLYRVDQVTVNLRAINPDTGVVVSSVSSTKTVLSNVVDVGVFRFIALRKLLEAEAGYSTNEPAQLCVQEAIETALIHLIVDGLRGGSWRLKNNQDAANDVIQSYLQDQVGERAAASVAAAANAAAAKPAVAPAVAAPVVQAPVARPAAPVVVQAPVQAAAPVYVPAPIYMDPPAVYPTQYPAQTQPYYAAPAPSYPQPPPYYPPSAPAPRPAYSYGTPVPPGYRSAAPAVAPPPSPTQQRPAPQPSGSYEPQPYYSYRR